MQKGRIHSIESFGSVDGPGVRYVIFVQGCRMRCQYCHNPETWALEKGELHTADEMLAKALRYRRYWGKDGGITVSGGEPLLQIDFVTELFEKAKACGVHTTVDTAGNPFSRQEPFLSKFNQLMQFTDLFMLDIKEFNEDAHKALTGWTNRNILDMARYLSESGKDMWIRHVLVPGITDREQDLRQLGAFVKSLKTVRRFEVLPYHTMGLYKWENLGIPYALKGISPPSNEETTRAEKLLDVGSYDGYTK